MSHERRFTYIITLDGCHHRPTFTLSPPMRGDVITCLWCRLGRTVTALKACFWEARCQTCEWRRSYGQVRRDCLDGAENHATKKNHIVQVWSPQDRLHKTVHAKGEQLALHFGGTATSEQDTQLKRRAGRYLMDDDWNNYG